MVTRANVFKVIFINFMCRGAVRQHTAKLAPRLTISGYAGIFLLILASSGFCHATLNAQVDRTEIAENESVELTISTALQMSSSLNLFNLNTLSIPQPDVSVVEKDFEILDRQQNYRVQIDNNRNNSVITWTYTLVPRNKGDITIPSISYEGEQTEPIAIRVRETSKKSTQDRDVFLESETDLQDVYVQQQLIYKIRLYYALDLVSGELEQPKHQDAQITQLGKQKEYSRYVGSKRFNVIERTYTVFPKTSGKLTIPPVNFSGTFYKRRMGKRVYFKDATDPVDITVKPPPPGFSGNLWLPAQSLSIRDVWSNPAREINVGDSLTRTIQVLALGVEGVQLPPLPKVNINGLKVYPEPGKTATEEQAAGVTGSREEVQALIATTPGTYTLPEIRIPWWDVSKDKERVAVLQGTVIKVLGAVPNTQNKPIPTATDMSTASTDSNKQALPDGSLAGVDQSGLTDSKLPWMLASAVLLGLWLITLFFWWRKPLQVSAGKPNDNAMQPSQVSFSHLEQLATQGSSRFVNEFSLWLTRAQQEGSINSKLADAIKKQTRPALNELQSHYYGHNQQQSQNSDLAKKIVQQVKTLTEQYDNKIHHELPPLYPLN
jgi:hypothetical protein